MDLPPPAQGPDGREEPDDSARRLAAVEATLLALGARLDRVEANLQTTVQDESRRASNEIRHTVSELGRRLALDLPQFLDRHRQLIVSELRGAAAHTGDVGDTPGGATPSEESAASGESGQPPTTDDGSSTAASGTEQGDSPNNDDASDGPVDAESSVDPDDPEGRRRKRRRRREG